MTDETPTPEPTAEDVEAHGKRPPGGSADATDDVDAHGRNLPREPAEEEADEG